MGSAEQLSRKCQEHSQQEDRGPDLKKTLTCNAIFDEKQEDDTKDRVGLIKNNNIKKKLLKLFQFSHITLYASWILRRSEVRIEMPPSLVRTSHFSVCGLAARGLTL